MTINFKRPLKVICLLVLCVFLNNCFLDDDSSTPTTYTIGGTVSGLTDTLVLENNSGDDLTLTQDGAFTFATAIADGEDYDVTVLTQPTAQTCSITNQAGTVSAANVSNVTVTCSTNAYTLSGTVSGLSGTVVLQNSGDDNVTITSDGSFTFSTAVAEGATYSVTVLTQPATQTCNVSNGSTTMGSSDVTDVSVSCEESIAYLMPLNSDASNAANIQVYSLSQDGLLSLSKNATQTEGHYGQMTFATVNGTQYVYILEDGVTYCSVNSEGTFENCAHTTAPTNGATHPRSIAFATVNGTQYAYFTDPSRSSLFQCSINTANGDLTSCSEYFSGNIDAAYGITFNTDASQAQHAYIADAAKGMVDCAINATDGSFTNCAITPSSEAPSWVPYGITFKTAGATQYAYVADNGAGINLGHVYQCLLNSDGTFQDNGCVATPTDASSFAPWNPYSIAFKTLNGTQYAYVINNQGVNIGSIYRCTVDETTGLLNQDCIKTPDISTGRETWQPSGITFR